jgi:uncharacterized membrane protein YgcG
VFCFWFCHSQLFIRFLRFPLARFYCTPASSCIFLFFSWRAKPLKRKAKGTAALEPAAARGGGSSGGGGGGSGV